MWITEEAIKQWPAAPRSTPGRQAIYSDSAIQTTLMLKASFKMKPRQTQGLLDSIFQLLGVDLSAPDYTTLSRRTQTLPPIDLSVLPSGEVHISN